MQAKRKADRPDEYLAGVPNRDLTDEDYDRLTEEQRAEVAASGLWDVGSAPAPPAEPPPPAEAAPESETS